MKAFFLLMAAGAMLIAPALADEPKKEEAVVQDNLDEMLRKKTPDLLKYLKSKKYANVGVVKFLVKKGDAAPSDNVGELNLSLANRLEVAMVLGNPDEDLGIIQQASKTIVKENNVRANHLTKEGRKAFFTGEYDLAWGPRKVTANAFVTGLVSIDKDLKQTKILFQVFDKDGELANIGEEVVMETSPRILTEAGYSYALNPEKHADAFAAAKKDRGNRFPRAVLVDKVVQQEQYGLALANTTLPKPAMTELIPYKEGPIKLTILYNGKPQAVDVTGRVAEPKETDTVTFVIENSTKEAYAVLLKVNGVNTLFKETTPDTKICHKWILRPGEKQIINGFQVDDSKVDSFKVLSPEESVENEVHYGAHAGTFRIACFQGTIVKEDPSIEVNKVREEDQLVRAAIGRGSLDLTDIKAGSLDALKRTLRGREKLGEGARGLVVPGGNGPDKPIEKFYFKYELNDPVSDATIRYYTPKR